MKTSGIDLNVKINALQERLKKTIREVPDFPKKGILFKDITPLLKNGSLFVETIDFFARRYEKNKPDCIACVESRGFLLGGPLAARLGVGLVLIRKKGKLPRTTKSITYDLEYGQDCLEVHEEDILKGEKVLLVDDVLATGGTMGAVIELLEGLHCDIVEVSFLIELMGLHGRDRIKKYPVYSLVQY
jgi:adenine phosphoribosyltransferase